MRAAVARSTSRGHVAIIIADNLKTYTAQGSLLVRSMLTELSGQLYLVYTPAYDPDANRIDQAEKDKITGSEVLVLNALRKEKHISHFNLDEAVAMARELGVPNAYFTHISHQLGKHADVTAELPKGIHLAYDGLTLTVDG